MKKKSILKKSLGLRGFARQLFFLLRPVFSPPQRTVLKEPLKKTTLKMVSNGTSAKPCVFEKKNFFSSLMHQVRVSFFIFFFFLSKALIDHFWLLATNEQKKGLNDQKWTNLELRIWILYFRHYQQNFPNTTPEHPGSRWTKENRGVQLIIPLKFHYGAMLAQHNQLHPDDRA